MIADIAVRGVRVLLQHILRLVERSAETVRPGSGIICGPYRIFEAPDVLSLSSPDRYTLLVINGVFLSQCIRMHGSTRISPCYWPSFCINRQVA